MGSQEGFSRRTGLRPQGCPGAGSQAEGQSPSEQQKGGSAQPRSPAAKHLLD